MAIFFALLALVSSGTPDDATARTTTAVDLSPIDTFPEVTSPTLHDINITTVSNVSARCMVAEVLEQEGRLAEAVKWAQSDLNVSE